MGNHRLLDDLLHELEDHQFGTKMRGYDPREVDAILERATQAIEDLRAMGQRASERATLAERQLEEEFEAVKAARDEAEKDAAKAKSDAAKLIDDARNEASELKAVTDAEIRVAIEDSRKQMMEELSEAESVRDRVLEEIEVTRGHMEAHRSRLLRSVNELKDLVESLSGKPEESSGSSIAATRPKPSSLSGPPDDDRSAKRSAPLPSPGWSDSGVVRPIRSVSEAPINSASAAEVVGQEADLDAFFADDGS